MSWDHIELSLEVKVQEGEGDGPKPSVAGAAEAPPGGFCGTHLRGRGMEKIGAPFSAPGG